MGKVQDNQQSISIIFGAGAESNLGICAGEEFAMAVLGIDSNYFQQFNIVNKESDKNGQESQEAEKNQIDSLNVALENYYSNSANDFYSKFYNNQWNVKKLLEAAIRKKILEDPEKEHHTKTSYEDEVENCLKYFCVDYDIKNDKKNEALRLMRKYASYMGIIDESFHTLIAPKYLGPHKFWRVVMCYARAYAYLIGLMLYPNEQGKDISEDDYKKIIEDPQYAIDLMKDFAETKMAKESYYSILRKLREENGAEIKVITTNYTTLCEHMADMESDEIAYVHGKFGWFESAKTLTVYDASDKNNPLPSNDVLFPYIFIQSGIKPIVDIRQLEEYGKMLGFMNNSDYIMVLGYKLNVDDNHINGIIRSQMLRGKNVVYFHFQEDNETSNQIDENQNIKSLKSRILKRLRIFDEDKETLGKNLEVIEIDKYNCFDKFENKLRQLIDKL